MRELRVEQNSLSCVLSKSKASNYYGISMKIFLFLILLTFTFNLSQCQQVYKRKCDRKLSLGANVHIFLLKLMGKYDVIKSKCDFRNSDSSSSEENEDFISESIRHRSFDDKYQLKSPEDVKFAGDTLT